MIRYRLLFQELGDEMDKGTRCIVGKEVMLFELRKYKLGSSTELMDYLREATEMECKLKKEELEFKKKQEERALAQQNLIFKQQQEMSRQFQDQLKNQCSNSSSR